MPSLLWLGSCHGLTSVHTTWTPFSQAKPPDVLLQETAHNKLQLWVGIQLPGSDEHQSKANSPEHAPCWCCALCTRRFDLRTLSRCALLFSSGGVAGHSAGYQMEACFEVITYQGSGSYPVFHLSLSHPWLQGFINQSDFLPWRSGKYKGIPMRLIGNKEYKYFQIKVYHTHSIRNYKGRAKSLHVPF